MAQDAKSRILESERISGTRDVALRRSYNAALLRGGVPVLAAKVLGKKVLGKKIGKQAGKRFGNQLFGKKLGKQAGKGFESSYLGRAADAQRRPQTTQRSPPKKA